MSQTNLKNFAQNCRKVIGAALNYRWELRAFTSSDKSLFHSREGFAPNSVLPADPVLFLKPISSLITEGQTIKVHIL